MPSWIIHLATANKISEKIKVDKNSFLIGNLIPDAQRYVIKDFSVYVPYNISHFAEISKIDGKIENLPNIDKFLNSYKNKMSNPIVLGYLTHLLTDYYWNMTTYFRYTIRDEQGNAIGVILNDGTKVKCSFDERSHIKHEDFALFENYIISQKDYIIPKYENNIINELKDVKEISFNKNDIQKIIKYLETKSSEKYIDGEYKLFTKEQILNDYEKSLDFVLGFLRNIKII